MPRNLWPAREERAAADKDHVATNRAQREERRSEMRQRAQCTKNDQAHETLQRRPARTNTMRLANTEPKRDAHEKLRREMLCRLTPELSGGAAVRLNEELGACAAPCLGDRAGATANPTKRNASSFGCQELAAALQRQRPGAED
jgi:hypothetical protein